MSVERTAKPQTSTRDVNALADRLAVWLHVTTGAVEPPTVEIVGTPEGSGMSSETVLADLAWSADDGGHDAQVVVRMPPAAEAWPVFPTYDLGRQARAMEWVRRQSTVPVPRVLWYERDPAPLGAPFVVMERVEGVTAPDVMPYTWGSWVTELAPDEQARIADATVEVLAALHGVDVTEAVARDLELPGEGTPLRRHVAHHRAHYEWAREGRVFPTIEHAFAVLGERWPDETDTCMSWGDARLGNIMWSDTDPVAVLDWESVAVAPREVDVGWMAFFGEYFQRSAQRRELPGIPGFLDRASVVRRYETVTGNRLVAFEWFLAYAAVRQAVVSIRTMGRAVHFGEVPAPDDPEGLILDLPFLAELVDELTRS